MKKILLFIFIAGLFACKKESECFRTELTTYKKENDKWVEKSKDLSNWACGDEKEKWMAKIVEEYGSRKGGEAIYCVGFTNGQYTSYKNDNCPSDFTTYKYKEKVIWQ